MTSLCFRFSFSDNGAHFFLTRLSFLLKNAEIDLLDIKSHKNCLVLPIDGALKKIIIDSDPLCSNDVIYRGKISIRF